MKKLLVAFIIVLLTFPYFVSTTLAHPGRTDSNGGHTCRTNCAKWGYKTGEYHYHNGGSSRSTSSTPSPSQKSTPSPKPTYSQADVDNGRDSGKTLGYEDGYSRENKNLNTTVGNEGYKKGYIAGYEAGYNEGLKKIKEEDTVAGTTLGKSAGKIAYEKGESREISPDSAKSDDWNSAYKAEFSKSFDREMRIDNSGQAGHELGYSLVELEVPSDLAKDEVLKTAFVKHYKTGYEKRIKEENDKHLKIGNRDGYDLSALAIDSLDNRFVETYKQGYEEGKLKRKEDTIAEGYQSAFVHMKYKETESNDHPELVEWHKEGFGSNEIAVQIKETAFENGLSSSEYTIPKEYKINDQSIALYDSMFQDGQEERAQEQKKKVIYTAGIGIPVGGIAVGGYLLRKRKVKKSI